MTAPDDAIRARRKLTNKLIAAREAARLKPFFTADAKVIPGLSGVSWICAPMPVSARGPVPSVYCRK